MPDEETPNTVDAGHTVTSDPGMDPLSTRFLTPTEVAERLSVSPITVRQWAQKGLLPAQMTAGGHRRFALADVEALLRRRSGQGGGGAIEGARQAVPPVASGARDTHGRAVRVLVVDDMPEYCELVVNHLRDSGAPVEIATANGGFDAGIQVVRFDPDVVVLDLMMPDMNGFDVCQRIKQHRETASIRVVAMTAHSSPEAVRRIMAAGAECLLNKPFDAATLLAACDLVASASR